MAGQALGEFGLHVSEQSAACNVMAVLERLPLPFDSLRIVAIHLGPMLLELVRCPWLVVGYFMFMSAGAPCTEVVAPRFSIRKPFERLLSFIFELAKFF
jgi:hypothetical protein